MGCSAEDLLKRHERLLSERAVWEAHCRASGFLVAG
jgi:hypothetical protein